MRVLLLAVAVVVLVALVYVGVRLPVVVLSAYAATVPIGSAISLPLSLPPPFDTPSSLLGFAAIATIALDAWVSGRRRSASLGAAHAAFVAFVGTCALTVGWSIDGQRTVTDVILLISVVALYVVSASARLSPRQRERFASGIVGGGVVASMFGVVLVQTGRVSGGNSGIPRFALTGNDPNHTAASLLLPLLIAADRAFDPGRRFADRAAWGAAAAITLTGITLTGSRGGLVAAAAGLLVVLRLRSTRAGALIAALVVVVVAGAVLSVTAPPELERRLATTSSTGRSDIWKLGLRSCDSYCLIGSGWGTFPVVYREEFRVAPDVGGFRDEGFRAHNIWLQALVETGIAGLALLIAGWTALFRRALKLDPQYRTAALATLTAMTLASSLVSNLTFKYVWLMAIFIGLGATARPSAEPQVPAATMLVAQRE